MSSWNLNDAYKVLRKDIVMKTIITKTGKLKAHDPDDVYFSLLRSITSQQLSTKAAATIFERFLELFPGRNPKAKLLLDVDVEILRQAGLSYSKAQYLKNIAQFSMEQSLKYNMLNRLNDKEVIDYLIQIKGVGKWTAEMILMFSMNRPDILPVDDLGIQQSMIHHYGLKGNGARLIVKMRKIAEPWKPFRSLACRHLWRSRDNM